MTWGVRALEWVGPEEAAQFNHEVEATRRGLLIPGERLLELSEQVWQVIEGEFVGYCLEADAQEFAERGSPLTWFTSSLAEMAFEFVDGCIIVAFLHSRELVDRLTEHFPDIRWQDPADFILSEGP